MAEKACHGFGSTTQVGLTQALGAMEPTHVPNKIPKGERIALSVFSLLLFAYGSYGVWANDFYVPRGRGRSIHLHGIPAWMLYGAVICACLVMLSIVVDHYDRRSNERHYRAFAQVFKVAGWSFFGMSVFAWMFGGA